MPAEQGPLGRPVVPEDTGCTVVVVVVPHIDKDLAGIGQGTGLDPQLEPLGLLEDCSTLRYIQVHRHPGMLQDKSGSLKIMQIRKKC